MKAVEEFGCILYVYANFICRRKYLACRSYMGWKLLWLRVDSICHQHLSESRDRFFILQNYVLHNFTSWLTARAVSFEVYLILFFLPGSFKRKLINS